jgi:thiamine-phosphate pyrophosphorylase
LADGLHLGQEDLISISIDYKDAITKIREKIGTKIFGLSTHNLGEISDANRFDIDYIGLGAFRDTNTKNVSTIGGTELLDIAKLSKHKVALIGGIKIDDNFENYPQISYKVIGSDLIKLFLKQKSK